MSQHELTKMSWSGLFKPHDGSIETLQTQLHWTLRVSLALCFIGHGAWGLVNKAGWLPFFASQGIEPELAWNLQRPIGVFDIAMGCLLLWKPRRIVVMWMFLWALWTAILRPLAGNLTKVKVEGEWTVQLATDSMNVPRMQTWEFWERAGNWGPAFLLLLMGGAFLMTSSKSWLQPYREPLLTKDKMDGIFWLCRFLVAALLIGHAGFGFAAHKAMLIEHWQSIGVDADVAFISQVGYFELALGFIVFFLPLRPIVWFVLVWKLVTELLYIPHDSNAGMGIINIFETVERFGDFGLPAVMLFIIGYRKANKKKTAMGAA